MDVADALGLHRSMERVTPGRGSGPTEEQPLHQCLESSVCLQPPVWKPTDLPSGEGVTPDPTARAEQPQGQEGALRGPPSLQVALGRLPLSQVEVWPQLPGCL